MIASLSHDKRLPFRAGRPGYQAASRLNVEYFEGH
jgi:hypothetical protein